MSAKKRESVTEVESQRYWRYDEALKITSCSISFRQAEWGPRIIISFRVDDGDKLELTEWVYPLFVANAEAHENKLRLGGDSHEFWSVLGLELQRVFTQGGVVTSLHNFESTGKNQRGDERRVAAII